MTQRPRPQRPGWPQQCQPGIEPRGDAKTLPDHLADRAIERHSQLGHRRAARVLQQLHARYLEGRVGITEKESERLRIEIGHGVASDSRSRHLVKTAILPQRARIERSPEA